MRSLLAQLQLVHSPISNQEAGWLADNEEFRAYVKRSKIYMLAQRQEVLFSDYSVNHETLEFSFNLNMGQENQTSLTFDIKQVVGDQFDTINIEVGPKLLRVWNVIEDNVKGGKELLYWATTDKLLYHIWRGYVEVSGEVNVRSFTRYSLYYVGISKSQDSISRLFDNGHKNRTRILDNETQITPIARLTDEIYIFLFDINELRIEEMTSAKPSDSDIYDFLDSTLTPKVNLVADAEKAFVSILQSKYNQEKYSNYPAGTDGIANMGFSRYSYVIDEDLEFAAPKRSYRGVHNFMDKPEDQPDFIFVEGDTVEVINHIKL